MQHKEAHGIMHRPVSRAQTRLEQSDASSAILQTTYCPSQHHSQGGCTACMHQGHEDSCGEGRAHHIVRLHRVLLFLIGVLERYAQGVDDPYSCNQRQEIKYRVDVILHHEAAPCNARRAV